ncbi:MAG: carbohydrate kinase family protein [Bacteroidales bacterium]|nr:carbohydrate kinase family protein [Bacteroidales bacterium]MBN2820452.1 carbohydrate kinase family protein [Bacteroidales bacterium]
MPKVYFYGMVTPITAFLLGKNFAYPKPNEYAELATTINSIGAKAVNSAFMLSRLGLETKLDGNWINTKNKEKVLRLTEPFKIEPLDITGAGDSFRADFLFRIAQKWTDDKIIEFTSAVAACVCLTVPLILNSPELNTDEESIPGNLKSLNLKK